MLDERIKKLRDGLADLKDKNKKEEEKLRADYNKADRNYHDSL